MVKDRIEIVKGDITEMKTDAIVNAANNQLILGAGVAGAIRKKGGPKIQEECNKIGPIKVGEAAITTGGNLFAKYVIHAASMSLGGSTTEESLRSSTRASLKIAKENGIKTIAFPAIGAGIGGFPKRECAKIMIGEAIEFLKKEDIPEKVYFVLYSDEMYNIFKKEFENL